MERLFNSISIDMYRFLISNNPDAIFLLDESGHVLDINKAGTDIFGYTNTERSELHYQNILVPSKDYNVKRLFVKTLLGEFCAYEADAYRKNGDILHLQVKNIPMLDNGEIFAVMIIAKDVTELVQTKSTLVETAERLHSLLHSSADAIDLIDTNRNVLTVNPAFEEMYGWKADELVGKPLPTIPKERMDTVNKQREELKNGHHIKGLEATCLKKDGSSIEVSFTLSPLNDQNGNVIAFSGISRDITERKKMEVDLRNSKDRYKSLLNASPEPIYVLSYGVIRYINLAAVEMFGFESPVQMLGRHVLDFVHPDSWEVVQSKIRRITLERNFPKEIVEQKMLRADRSTFLTETTSVGIEYEDESAVQVILRDITEKKVLLENLVHNEEKYRLIAENMTDLVSVIDENGQTTYVSPSYFTVLGIPLNKLEGVSAKDFVHPEDLPNVMKVFKQIMSTKGSANLDFRLKHATKTWLWVESKATFFIDEQYGKPFLLIVSRDVEEKKQLREKLKLMAFHDSLTGLPNRRLFEEKMQQSLKEAKRQQRKCALFYMDIDKFKWVNDNLGHSIGDELLKLFAHRVSKCIRDKDILARQGGDEFTILLSDIEHKEDAHACAERILESLQQVWEIGEHNFKTTSSIGIAFFPKDGDNINKLFTNADYALYEAKKSGRNTYRFFSH
ncbi:PAS domain S-box protein [Psychrobacillus psychrodurans]|uniref:PAS domain S-box protein n=1 Tax=Psychrobacillus psychrodurans TaxID=126157 RepID=A0A9X3LAJ6_9BACI|nr:PAS domain S-box protein [Psychrobacillus psychrodurans]MCZ8534298.1 PAS domain S-box protein [Psychrobacillus psychrodurans]